MQLYTVTHCACVYFPAGTAAAQFTLSTVTVSAESVNGSVRVTWNTTAPLECVAAVTVEFRTTSRGPVVASNTTNNTSQTEFIQTGLQCGTYYYITVVVTGVISDGQRPTRSSRTVQVAVSGGKFSYCKCAWEINLMVIHITAQMYLLQLE